MLNSDDFIKRLENILEYYGLSASSFADSINVQRSSLSHLLSGRNKPSLDFILKIVEEYPDVDLYWILNGIGSFPKSKIIEQKKSDVPPPSLNIEINKEEQKKSDSDLFSQNLNDGNTPVFEKNVNKFPNMQNLEQTKNSSNIERIVVFYKNGSFKEYLPE